MIEETATVVEVKKHTIVVEAAVKTTCGGCQANTHCGTGVVARALANKTQSLELACERPVSVGQQVVIGLPEAHLLGASLWIYVIPLLALIGAASVGHILLPWLGLSHEAWNLLFTVFVTMATFVAVSGYVKRDSHAQFTPSVIRVLPQSDAVHCQAISLE
ncbi:SoxR reducing system RseC family protein [Aestuariibacter salexigens]|uniref:SoxR reducing system RseC family protein n=1 Tax=Aestuariibacter salexigens TaxID=226010 RepID=UPI00040921CB|nr:SoxR reducing system RseC family protein [Aestuariibacter salexigens]